MQLIICQNIDFDPFELFIKMVFKLREMDYTILIYEKLLLSNEQIDFDFPNGNTSSS